MSERKIISAAIEPAVDDRIVKLAEKLGLSKSNLIANMLESFLPTAEELTRDDILREDTDEPEDEPEPQPTSKLAVPERKTRPKADDDSADDGEPEHAEEPEDEEEGEAAAEEDSDEATEDDEEEVTEDDEAEAAPAPMKRKKPPVVKPKAKKKGKK